MERQKNQLWETYICALQMESNLLKDSAMILTSLMCSDLSSL